MQQLFSTRCCLPYKCVFLFIAEIILKLTPFYFLDYQSANEIYINIHASNNISIRIQLWAHYLAEYE